MLAISFSGDRRIFTRILDEKSLVWIFGFVSVSQRFELQIRTTRSSSNSLTTKDAFITTENQNSLLNDLTMGRATDWIGQPKNSV